MAKGSAPAPAGGEEGYRVPAVERAFAIIRVLAAQGPLSLADVVGDSGLNKSTTFYILRTLVGLDVVAYDERNRTYTLGPALMELGLSAGGQFNDIAVARRQLAGLLDSIEATIVLYRRVSVDEIIMIDKLERPHQVRIAVQAGVHLPIQGGSFGRAFLAFDEPAVLNEALRGGLHRFTPKSLTRVGEFRKQLAQVRQQGWAVDHEGFALGVSTVAAPIFGPDGTSTLVAAAVGFTSLFTESVTRSIGQQLRLACDEIGAILGNDRPRFPLVGAGQGVS